MSRLTELRNLLITVKDSVISKVSSLTYGTISNIYRYRSQVQEDNREAWKYLVRAEYYEDRR